MTETRKYIHGEIHAVINFPESQVACKWCWLFLQCDQELHRYRCKLTGEPIQSPHIGVGAQCPLQFKGDDADGIPSNDSR